MVVLWDSFGFQRMSMGFPLDSYGVSMVFLWDFLGCT